MASVWTGTGLPLSVPFALYLRRAIDRLGRAVTDGHLGPSPELAAFLPIAAIQRSRSHIPLVGQTLAEEFRSRDGHHLFLYTWEGSSVNEGLGHVVAFRLARRRSNTISVSANNHGFELLSSEPMGSPEAVREALTDLDQLEPDIHASLNYPELARQAFREVARVAGLIHQGTPFAPKSARHLQMSSSLLFDVFREYEPDHPLLHQAYREVSERQLELARLRSVMQRIGAGEFIYKRIEKLTPFAFPLYVERIKSRLSTETLEERIARLQREVFAD
jgi:ATP-dependent Lhr-like helicase